MVGVARQITAGSSEREILKLTAIGLRGRARLRRWLDGRGAPGSSCTRQSAPDHGVATVLLPLVVGLTCAHELEIARDDLQPGSHPVLPIGPGPRFQSSVDEHPHPLLEVLRERLRPLPEDDHAHPLGAVFPLPLGRPRSKVAGDVDSQRRRAARAVSQLGIIPQVADDTGLEHLPWPFWGHLTKREKSYANAAVPPTE